MQSTRDCFERVCRSAGEKTKDIKTLKVYFHCVSMSYDPSSFLRIAITRLLLKSNMPPLRGLWDISGSVVTNISLLRSFKLPLATMWHDEIVHHPQLPICVATTWHNELSWISSWSKDYRHNSTYTLTSAFYLNSASVAELQHKDGWSMWKHSLSLSLWLAFG